MKKTHIIYTILSLFILLGCVSCSESINNSNDIDISGSSKNGICLDWTTSQAHVMEQMKDADIQSQDGTFLEYSDMPSSKVAYSFKNDSLVASVATFSMKNTKKSDVTKMLSKYKYVGDINTASVYTCAGNNTMAALSTKEINAEQYYILGFAPIESDLYENIPLPKVTTLSASKISSGKIRIEGKLENASIPCQMGFQYSANKDLTNARTVLRTSDTETFELNIINLEMGTTYYYRACAVVDDIYYYGETLSFTTEILKTYQIGDLYPNETAPEGVVYYTNNDGTAGRIISLDTGYGKWDTTGLFCKKYNCNSTSYGFLNDIPTDQPYGKWVKSHGDKWYGPARDELKTLSKVIATVNSTLSRNGYDKIEGFFWSSTEHKDYSQAYVVCVSEDGFMNYSNGSVFTNSKNESNRFITVKSF